MHLTYHRETQISFKEGGKYADVVKSSLHSQTQEQVRVVGGECREKLLSENELDAHKKKHAENKINCKNCAELFTSKKLLFDHVKIHEQPEVEECHNSRRDQKRIESNEKQFISSKYQCSKCDNSYFDMRKLRRHDWRAHRQIECSICMETLTSRQQLKEHRQHVHKMLKKIPCKFYPECFDEDECLFEHTNLISDISYIREYLIFDISDI